MSYASLKVSEKQHEFIKKAAKKADKAIGDFTYQCVLFVSERNYNPYGLEEIHVAEEFKKLKNQLISFIRTQEKDILKPVQESVMDMRKQMVGIQGSLQQIVINTAESPEPVKQTPTPNAIGSPQTHDLEKALSDKDMKLKRAVEALKKLKQVSIPGKTNVTLQITPEMFAELVAIP